MWTDGSAVIEVYIQYNGAYLMTGNPAFNPASQCNRANLNVGPGVGWTQNSCTIPIPDAWQGDHWMVLLAGNAGYITDLVVTATGGDQPPSPPTPEARLHHCAPSTPWSATAGLGVNVVCGNFVHW
jgi:hypothetical protein